MKFKLTSFIPSEADHQASLIQFARCHWWGDFLIHQPNEQLLLSTDSRKWGILQKLKKMGLRSGTPDLLLMIPSQGYHGFFLELKKQDVKKLPYYQQAFLDRARAVGYKAEWSNNLENSIQLLKGYVSAASHDLLSIKCRFCLGTAKYNDKTCKACMGSGKDWEKNDSNSEDDKST